MGGEATGPGLVEATLNHRFDDVSLIGSGGDGYVYRARQRSTRRVVGIKVLINRHLPLHDPAGEAAVHASVSAHPNVLTLFDADETADGVTYLVCEYAPSSASRLIDHGAIAADEALRIGQHVADALSFIHRLGVIHGDLTPSNILIGLDGGVRLADFGASVRHGGTPPTLDPIRGSVPYVAPEVIEGARPTEAADVYGLALSIWCLLEGRAPYETAGSSLASVVAQIGVRRLSFDKLRSAPELRRAADLLETATDPDPGARPTAAELAVGLAPRAAGAVIVAPDEPSRRGRLVFAAVATAVAIVGGLAFAAADDRQDRPVLPVNRVELCRNFDDTQRVATQEMQSTTAALQDASGAPDVAIQQFLSIPNRFADQTRPVLRVAAADPAVADLVGALDADSMRRLVLTDATTRLATGRFLFDDLGQPTPEVSGLSVEMRRAVAAYSSVMTMAHQMCPNTIINLVDAKSALVDSVRGLLEGKNSVFFADLTTADRIDPLTVELMMTTDGDYFQQMLAGHPDWLLRLLGREAIRVPMLTTWSDQTVNIIRINPAIGRKIGNEHPVWVARLVLSIAHDDADQLVRIVAELTQLTGTDVTAMATTPASTGG